VVAVVLGGIGLILRAAHARGDRLDEQRERADERGRAAVAQERRRFAGELHDGIAHDLTVIALHAQMLDDPDEAVRRTAQATIQATTRNALGDLRYVIEMADDGPRDAAGFSSDPATALRQASETLEAAGYPVQVPLGALSRAPRRIGVVCARVRRECVTNVLKHAGPGTVGLDVEERDGHLHLTVRSSLPANRRSDLPSAGTGVARMSGHVRELGGELRAGADSGCWVVVARMPIA
jgi:signal transduction histidine kinase